MKRFISSLMLWVAAALPAHAMVIDTFQLDMGQTNGGGTFGVNSSVVLNSSTSYVISVSGTFEIGCIGVNPACPADAEYYVPSSGTNAGQPFDLTGFDDPFGVDIGVAIDGVKIDWGPFNLARIYSTTMMGTDSTIFVNYIDPGPTDNQGFLTVSIAIDDASATVSEPATVGLLLAAGLVGGLRRVRARSMS